MRVALIIPAAGEGKRIGGRVPKAFIPVAGKPLIIHTLLNIKRAIAFEEIVVAIAVNRTRLARQVLDRFGFPQVRLASGGATRAESVWNALQTVSPRCHWILVHDAARPLIESQSVRKLLKEVKYQKAGLLVEPVSSTVKEVRARGAFVRRTLDRSKLYLAQTPQVARRDVLLKAYEKLGRHAFAMTDESAILEKAGVEVKMVVGSSRNIKITTREDLKLFSLQLLTPNSKLRTS